MASKTLNTELYNALSSGDIKRVNDALSLGADVNGDCPGYEGWTPLMKAAEWGRADAVELLLKKGAKINAKNPQIGDTALHLAAREGRTDAVRALMKGKPDLTVKNKDGETPFDMADERGELDIIKLLKGK